MSPSMRCNAARLALPADFAICSARIRMSLRAGPTRIALPSELYCVGSSMLFCAEPPHRQASMTSRHRRTKLVIRRRSKKCLTKVWPLEPWSGNSRAESLTLAAPPSVEKGRHVLAEGTGERLRKGCMDVSRALAPCCCCSGPRSAAGTLTLPAQQRPPDQSPTE